MKPGLRPYLHCACVSDGPQIYPQATGNQLKERWVQLLESTAVRYNPDLSPSTTRENGFL